MIDQNELAELALASVRGDMFEFLIGFSAHSNDWRYKDNEVNSHSWYRSIEDLRINTAGSIYWHARTGRWK